MPKVSLVKCNDYNKAENAVREAVKLLGGIFCFCKSGEKILIKPTLLRPKYPSKAITTRPEIVISVIKLIKENGTTHIIGDGPDGAVRDIKNLVLGR